MQNKPKQHNLKPQDSPSYRIAYKDLEFLERDELRGTRLLLEYNKVELLLKDEGIHSTIIMFGSARAKEDEPIYQQAYKLAHLIATKCSEQALVCSGGGPGVMEAANRGAHDAGSRTIGLNISLPHEQAHNQYISPEFCFKFNYFAIRKMHFLRRAIAMIAFPGGFGTMDELFETLTLIQTKRIAPIPVILFNKEWWTKVVNFEILVESGTISRSDLDLFDFAETAEQAWQFIQHQTQE